MSLSMRLFIVIALLCLTLSPVSARDVQDLNRDSPCKSDIAKFCRIVKPGNGRVLRCMKQYDLHLSDACKEHIVVVKENTRKFLKACRKDIHKFCNGVEKGEGRIYDCLKQHQPGLAARCADHVW